MTAYLRCRDLHAGYGGNSVVRGIDLEVGPGEVVAVLGPNGAGKTTLMNTIAGLQPAVSGSYEIENLSAPAGRRRRRRTRVVLLPDDRSLFTTLTARENIVLGQRRGGPDIDRILEWFPALNARLDLQAGSLSGGEQQQLAMARALVQEPSILLIDELSMGVAPIVVDSLLQSVRRIADDTGAAVLLVEQHSKRALRIADRAMVLVHGEKVLEAEASYFLEHNQALEAAYLGERSAIDPK